MAKENVFMNQITYQDFERILGFKLEDHVRDQIEKFNLSYRKLSNEERDIYILNVLNVLMNDITQSGEHRIKEWESGWGENLEIFKSTRKIEGLIPKYHGKNRIVRWLGEPIFPLTENFDYKIHICFVDAILSHYIKNVENVYEFGCGPAYHLIRLNDLNPLLNLNGGDWAESSQEIIKEINKTLGTQIGYFNFNFFNPDYNINIPSNSVVYTVAALEQIGENFKPFIEFLISKNPKICIHMEPIDELLDDTKLIDNLSIKYFRKRKYLNNFLPYLEDLEKKGEIEILDRRRIYSGSYFIEGHSLIVWRNKK